MHAAKVQRYVDFDISLEMHITSFGNWRKLGYRLAVVFSDFLVLFS
jgi:hypothetical protein